MNVGARLRHAREQRGLTLERLSRATRITIPILDAIEQDNQRAIPPRPYGRGFVRAYAVEVGLDPDETVHDFFGQFAPPPPPPDAAATPAPPARRQPLSDQRSREPVVLILLFAIAAGALTMAGLGAGRRGEPEAVGTSGPSTPGSATALGRNAARHVADATTSNPLAITLEARGPSWVTATSDGRRVIYRMLHAGDREVLKAEREITIRTGDAGALHWRVGNGAVTPMGNPGQVRTVRITNPSARP